MERKEIYGIPPTRERRAELRRLVGEFAAARPLTPPLSVETLEALAAGFVASEGLGTDL